MMGGAKPVCLAGKVRITIKGANISPTSGACLNIMLIRIDGVQASVATGDARRTAAGNNIKTCRQTIVTGNAAIGRFWHDC